MSMTDSCPLMPFDKLQKQFLLIVRFSKEAPVQPRRKPAPIPQGQGRGSKQEERPIVADQCFRDRAIRMRRDGDDQDGERQKTTARRTLAASRY